MLFFSLFFFSLHNLEDPHLRDQAKGNMSCTTWNTKRDEYFCSLCGKREGVSSVISGTVDVATRTIAQILARCSLECMGHPESVF